MENAFFSFQVEKHRFLTFCVRISSNPSSPSMQEERKVISAFPKILKFQLEIAKVLLQVKLFSLISIRIRSKFFNMIWIPCTKNWRWLLFHSFSWFLNSAYKIILTWKVFALTTMMIIIVVATKMPPFSYSVRKKDHIKLFDNNFVWL